MTKIFGLTTSYRLIVLGTFGMFLWVFNFEFSSAGQSWHALQGFSQYGQKTLTYANINKYPPGIQSTLNSTDRMLENLTVYSQTEYTRQLYFDAGMILLILVLALFAINVFFFTRVEVSDHHLRIYTPFSALLGPFARPITQDLDNISLLTVTRVTPLGPDLSDASQICWRDRLDFGNLSVPGFLYTDLRKIFMEVTSVRREMEVKFRKNTLADNAREYRS